MVQTQIMTNQTQWTIRTILTKLIPKKMANQNKNTIQNKSSHNEEKQNRDKNIQTTEFVNIITEQMNRGSKRLNFFVKLLPIWDEKTQLLKHKPRILLES